MMEMLYNVILGRTSAALPKPPGIKGAVFRANGIPEGTTISELHAALKDEFEIDTLFIDKLCPSCCDYGSQTALIEFTPSPPPKLAELSVRGTYEVPLVRNGTEVQVSIDRDFYGLTQLYPTSEPIQADVVAVCGLNGHAYGSWAGEPNGKNGRRQMWLRHFFSQDFPQCRTMTFGYDSNFATPSIYKIPDFSDRLIEELKKARSHEEEVNRPIIFIGHSFGGVIIAQTAVKVKERKKLHIGLFSSIRAIIFCATPHRGFVVDDILEMIGNTSAKAALVKSLSPDSLELGPELIRFVNYCPGIKIVSLTESDSTRKLKQNPDKTWSRTGDYHQVVDSNSSVLRLPDVIEESLKVEGDHSTIVKFKNKSHGTYTTITRHVRNWVLASDPKPPALCCKTLYQAVKKGCSKDLDWFLRQPPSTSCSRGPNGTTPLHLAVEKHELATVAKLLRYKASGLKAVDADGKTPLHRAAMWGDQPIVEALLMGGADINLLTEDEDKYTALHLAAMGGHTRTVKLLLESGANITAVGNDGETALHTAAWGSSANVATIETLLEHGADVTAVGNTGGTPLHFACHRGNLKVISPLISGGSDVAAVDSTGCTALHFAARAGNMDIVRTLLENGASISARLQDGTKEGDMALHVATQEGHVEVTELLIREGADVDARGNQGYTPLHYASLLGRKLIVELLVSKGAKVAERTQNEEHRGFTALHFAAREGHCEVVDILVRNGASLHSTAGTRRETALELAKRYNHPQVVELLTKAPHALTFPELRQSLMPGTSLQDSADSHLQISYNGR